MPLLYNYRTSFLKRVIVTETVSSSRNKEEGRQLHSSGERPAALWCKARMAVNTAVALPAPVLIDRSPCRQEQEHAATYWCPTIETTPTAIKCAKK
jgi:hypothetical protein